MKILVINRIDDSTCKEAMRLIPESEVRVESEDNHEACRRAFTEFRPDAIVVSDPTDPKGISTVSCEKDGLRVWHPSSVLLRKPPYNLFIDADYHNNRSTGYMLDAITDFNELAAQVIEWSMPGVSVLITDPDKAWQRILRDELAKIPRLMVHILEDGDGMYEVIQEKNPEIVITEWMLGFSPTAIRMDSRDSCNLKIAILSATPEREINKTSSDADFVLCKTSPIEILGLMVEHWTKQIREHKRRELLEGLLANQGKVIMSR